MHTQDEEGNISADEDIKEEDLDYLEEEFNNLNDTLICNQLRNLISEASNVPNPTENLTGYQKNLGNPSFTATPSTSQHELDNIG